MENPLPPWHETDGLVPSGIFYKIGNNVDSLVLSNLPVMLLGIQEQFLDILEIRLSIHLHKSPLMLRVPAPATPCYPLIIQVSEIKSA